MADLPCDGDGVCMVCKTVPPDSDVLLCNGCVSPWHMQCLNPPLTAPPAGDWFCPDCSLSTTDNQSEPVVVNKSSGAPGDDLISQIRAIQADPKLSEDEKARKRQELMASGSSKQQESSGDVKGSNREAKRNKVLEMFDESLNCTFCMQLPERPVTTPCGHNFCLKCFQKWMGQGKKICAKCRSAIPSKMASQPRINSALVIAIRMAKAAANAGDSQSGPPKVYTYIQNQDKPDKAFMTERAKRKGLSNAASGRIFVTVPPDHFGPILAENDPERNQGVLVGECWGDRMECRQWGAHLPHVAGISGQSDYGAQSVALSGGYEDDEDHGEWFLYTGSGGRDLSGNKRTNKEQSFDQKFDKSNEALRVSCKMGYPLRVVRSHKEKRSSYAPEGGVRYDGIYRIEKCWRKKGIQGFKVCRYLFVRCDNEPAPWTSDECGDRPRPLPKIDELKDATDITTRKREPAWDWKDEKWGWTRDPPPSKKVYSEDGKKSRDGTRRNKFLTIKEKLLREFSCSLCKKVLTLPLSTPCGHNFCKACIEGIFAGQQDVRERSGVGGRSLRAQKIVKRCPSCQGDITDFLVKPQVNRQMEDVIGSLKGRVEDGSGSDGGDEEDQDQSEGIKIDEAVDEKCVNMQQAEGPEKPKVVPANTLESATNNEQEKSLEVEEAVDTKLQAHVNERPLNADQEKSINELHNKYPRYSEELLKNMLADQDGDLKELEALLKTLQRQEIRAANRKVSGPSSSKATDNTNVVSTESSPLKLQNASNGKIKGKSPKKRGRDASSSVGKVYKTRRKTASDNENAKSSGCPKTPTRDNLNSASPSSPLLVVSDSDFE